MPSIAAYTPLESLLFFQSVARHGADEDTLAEISESLNANEFIRDDGKYSPSRLKPEALQGLYNTLVQAEREEKTDHDGSLNGHPATNGSNPRKRKLSPASTPPNHSPKDDERLITELGDRLYAQYKEQIIREIRQGEEEYDRLQREIAELESATPREPLGGTDRTSQDGKPVEQTPQTVAGLSAAAKDGDRGAGGGKASSSSSSSSSLQAQLSPKEEVNAGDLPYQDGAPGPPSKPAHDPLRVGSEDISVASQPPVPRPPVPQGPSPMDMNTRQFPSPSSVNAQRGPSLAPTQSSQSPRNRTLPLPAPYPQHPGYGPINAPHAFQGPASPHSPVILPPPPGMAHMAHQRTPSEGGPSRVTPISLPHPQPYQPYPPYHYSQAPWPPPPHPNQQYPQHPPPYASQHFYPQPLAGRHPYPPQSPNQSPYPYYPQSAPANRPIHPSIPQPGMPTPVYPRQRQSVSASSTSVSDRTGRWGVPRTSGSHTPWTPKAGAARNPRPASPVRPDRDISPLSDPGSPSMAVADDGAATPASDRRSGKSGRRRPRPTASSKVKSENQPSGRVGRLGRRKRGDSNASSMGSQSRSQSLVSLASDSRPDRASTARKVKNEPPSTPAPLPSDNDQQRSSGLRRGRGNTVPSQLDTTRSAMKRKRDSTHEVSPSPSLPTPRGPSGLRPRAEATDPNLVLTTKNFARLTGTIMNDVTTHKHAGIFAKPLSEREAPGYKDLIYRPQDLKSIKTAIGRGSRAANAALDELAGGEEGHGAETPNKGSGVTNTVAAGMTLLKKTDELAPPKGIVNSSQLEMELMRLFANAVMFNPLPANECGFGPRFKMQRVDEQGAADRDGTRDADEEGGKGYSYVQVEEGGIIEDTRGMFEYVEKSVGDWRSAELGLGEATLPRSTTGVGLRGGSVSSALGDDNDVLSDAEGMKAETGISRKRRKVEA